MDKSKNNLIVLWGAGLFLVILVVFGIMGARSDPGSVGLQSTNYQIDASVIPEVSAEDHIRGDLSNPAVTLIEYSDIECPFCHQYHRELMTLTVDRETEDFAWVYRHFPLNRIHPDAERYGVATECAADQGVFWPFIDTLVNVVRTETNLSNADLSTLAANLEMDRAAFRSCLNDNTYINDVRVETQQALDSGATGTPFSVFAFDRSLSDSQVVQLGNFLGQDNLTFDNSRSRMAVGGVIAATQIEQIVEVVVNPAEIPTAPDISEGTDSE